MQSAPNIIETIASQDSEVRGVPQQGSFLTVVRGTGARPPLFCIYPGPPGSYEFADMLPEDQPVYDFYFSKLSSDAVFPTAEQLAREYIKEVRTIQGHGPYQICGYSNAGLVAYEMALTLTRDGEEVPLVGLIDAWHPQFVRNLSLLERISYRGIRFLARLNKYKRLLHRGQFNDFAAGSKEFFSKRAKSIGWKVLQRLRGSRDMPAPTSMKVVEVNSKLENYSPGHYENRVILIRPGDAVEKTLRDTTVGWRTCVSGGVDVHFIAPLHGDMMNRPHVRAVLDVLTPFLAEASPAATAPIITERFRQQPKEQTRIGPSGPVGIAGNDH